MSSVPRLNGLANQPNQTQITQNQLLEQTSSWDTIKRTLEAAGRAIADLAKRFSDTVKSFGATILFGKELNSTDSSPSADAVSPPTQTSSPEVDRLDGQSVLIRWQLVCKEELRGFQEALQHYSTLHTRENCPRFRGPQGELKIFLEEFNRVHQIVPEGETLLPSEFKEYCTNKISDLEYKCKFMDDPKAFMKEFRELDTQINSKKAELASQEKLLSEALKSKYPLSGYLSSCLGNSFQSRSQKIEANIQQLKQDLQNLKQQQAPYKKVLHSWKKKSGQFTLITGILKLNQEDQAAEEEYAARLTPKMHARNILSRLKQSLFTLNREEINMLKDWLNSNRIVSNRTDEWLNSPRVDVKFEEDLIGYLNKIARNNR